jgi:hypothetical protein
MEEIRVEVLDFGAEEGHAMLLRARTKLVQIYLKRKGRASKSIHSNSGRILQSSSLSSDDESLSLSSSSFGFNISFSVTSLVANSVIDDDRFVSRSARNRTQRDHIEEGCF